MATAQLKGSSSEERRAIFLFVCCSIIVDCLVFPVDVAGCCVLAVCFFYEYVNSLGLLSTTKRCFSSILKFFGLEL